VPEAADSLQDAMEAVSKRRVPCKIAALVGPDAWRRFSALDDGILRSLERAQRLEEVLQPRRVLDACGQAPCPGACGTLTDGGEVCWACQIG
jgi:hypothetical protein